MNIKAAVITVSDKGSQGLRVDTSGPSLCSILEQEGCEIIYTTIVPDEMEDIRAALIHCADELEVPLVLTTGGTGFAPRDITPEATLSVIEKETPGLPEAMRAESMRITPRGCLSRARAGIRKNTLIVNLPGSEKASKENLLAVLPALDHAFKMLFSTGSAECAQTAVDKPRKALQAPSLDAWLKEAKAAPEAKKCGMFLTHNGVVRETPRAEVREGAEGLAPVTAMEFSYDEAKCDAAVAEAKRLPGIHYVRVWLNSGRLLPGDDIMFVLIGGDIRPHVVDALNFLVGKIKSECVTEKEIAD